MLSFQFSFDDYDEAGTALAAFAYTCRQLKVTFDSRPKKPAMRGRPESQDRTTNEVETSTEADAADGAETETKKPRRERKSTKSQKSEAAKVSEAVNAPHGYEDTDGEADVESEPEKKEPAKKETVKVTAPKEITLDHIRELAKQLTGKHKKGGALVVGDILKATGVNKIGELEGDDVATVYHKLTKALTAKDLDDEIPF